MATMIRAARTIFSQVLPMLMTLMPSGLVFHRYGSMCTWRFLLPRWHCAASKFSMSVDVGLKIAGRLLGAIFAGLRAERCEEGSVVSKEEKEEGK